MADYCILLGQVDNLDIDLSETRYVIGKGIEDVKQFGERIMKIYVDELPKDCFECPCFKDDIEFSCGLDGLDDDFKGYFKDEINGEKCPLQTIKQLKQSIIEDIKHRLAEQRTKMRDDNHCYLQTVVSWQDIIAILDQVKGENNELQQ